MKNDIFEIEVEIVLAEGMINREKRLREALPENSFEITNSKSREAKIRKAIVVLRNAKDALLKLQKGEK